MGFAVPRHSPDCLLRAWRHAPMSEQGYEREQPQKRRRCSTPDRHLRPLPLGFEPHMPARLLEGHLKLSAHHEPADDLLRIGFEVGTKEGLGFELSFRITHQHPTQGYGRQARGVPNGRRRSDLDHAIPTTVPVSDRGWLPSGGRVFGYIGELGHALALYAWPPSLSRTAHRSRLVEGGIKPKTGDEGHRLAQRSAAI